MNSMYKIKTPLRRIKSLVLVFLVCSSAISYSQEMTLKEYASDFRNKDNFCEPIRSEAAEAIWKYYGDSLVGMRRRCISKLLRKARKRYKFNSNSICDAEYDEEWSYIIPICDSEGEYNLEISSRLNIYFMKRRVVCVGLQ